MFTEPKKGASGLFAVDWATNFVQWMAWREWYHEEFGKIFFPQTLTVLFAWPPTSGQGAFAVSSWLKEIREAVEREPSKAGGGPCAAVPEHVAPWREWDRSLKQNLAERENDRRAKAGGSFAMKPEYPWRASIQYRQPAPMAAE